MRKYWIIICFCLPLFLNAQEADEYGIASYYADSFQGKKTASGELYDKNKLTAAHKTLPFGTLVRVTRLDNKRAVKVRINDRGPYFKGRVVDISRQAAEALDLVTDGKAKVKVEVIGKGVLKEPELVVTIPKEKPKPKDYNEAELITGTTATRKTENTKPAATKAKPEPKPEATTIAETKPEPKPVAVSKPTTETKPAPATVLVPKGYTTTKVTGKTYQEYDLYKVDLKRPTKVGFGVQVASLSQYENVLRQVADLQEKWFDNILLSVEPAGDDTHIYKIILGPFPDRKTATSYKEDLKKKKKMEGFVVDLSQLTYVP